MESHAITYGYRIKFDKQENLMISQKIFDVGHKKCRVIIDTTAMTFKLVDPVTGLVHKEIKKDIKNLEVLQRHVKKELKDFGVKFTKETRKKSDGK